jgi:hypothetical protein
MGWGSATEQDAKNFPNRSAFSQGAEEMVLSAPRRGATVDLQKFWDNPEYKAQKFLSEEEEEKDWHFNL